MAFGGAICRVTDLVASRGLAIDVLPRVHRDGLLPGEAKKINCDPTGILDLAPVAYLATHWTVGITG